MIRIERLHFGHGARPLFVEAEVTLNPGEKVGLIGANGTGKSTLFALLRGVLHPDGGELRMPPGWRLAHVAQETPASERSALDYAIDGDAHLRALEAELVRLDGPMAGDAGEEEVRGERIAELHGRLADADAYTARARAERLLAGLGFSQTQMAMPVARFSGGWRMRLNLAQALMCPSDLLLLDEPTNHLDLDAILWLEDWIHHYPGTLIVISHDRDFLDGVTHVIVHIDGQKLRRYGGNYAQFERTRALEISLNQSQIEKQNRERAHLQHFIDRFKAKATKAKQAQSRMKMLAKMVAVAPLHAASPFSFEFREPLAAPDLLLATERAVAGYRSADGASRPIVSDIDFTLHKGQRIGLLGVNGAGKSTLMKTLAGELPRLDGAIRYSTGIAIGYFAQHQLDSLREDESPLKHLMRLAPDTREQDLRNFLGGFNFSADRASSPVSSLSGGERARLALALIVWKRPNLLLLDEPTNHLDLETRAALTHALAQFEGALVLVSHDRHLLRAVTDEFMIVADGRLRPFPGDLDDYRDWLFRTRLTERSPPSAAADQDPPDASAPKDARQQKRLAAEARQRRAQRLRPIEARLAVLERQMTELGARKTDLDRKLADPDAYAQDRKTQLQSWLIEQAALARDLEQAETEWLERQAELESGDEEGP